MNGRHYEIQIDLPAAASLTEYVEGDAGDVAEAVARILEARRVSRIKVRPIPTSVFVLGTGRG